MNIESSINEMVKKGLENKRTLMQRISGL